MNCLKKSSLHDSKEAGLHPADHRGDAGRSKASEEKLSPDEFMDTPPTTVRFKVHAKRARECAEATQQQLEHPKVQGTCCICKASGECQVFRGNSDEMLFCSLCVRDGSWQTECPGLMEESRLVATQASPLAVSSTDAHVSSNASRHAPWFQCAGECRQVARTLVPTYQRRWVQRINNHRP